MLAIRILVLGRCWSEILQIPARDFFDEIAPLGQVFPQFVYVLGPGEATTHPYNGNRFVLRSRTRHFGGGKTLILPASALHLRGTNLWETYHDLANVLPIFQVAIGIFDSLPVKHLTDRGSNDPFLHQMEHFTTILLERYGIFHCQSA